MKKKLWDLRAIFFKIGKGFMTKNFKTRIPFRRPKIMERILKPRFHIPGLVERSY